jgi:hypothetical protein
MKKLTTVLTLLALVATPVYASDRYPRDRDDDNTAEIAAGVLGGLVLGIIIADKKKDRDDRYYCERRDRKRCYDDHRKGKHKKSRAEWRHSCEDYYYKDRYGNWQTRRICD